jgi:hypothetical protein
MSAAALCKKPQHRWQHQEASRNWLALGLLLAAWNATDSIDRGSAAVRRPDALRTYPQVSVRAAQRLRGLLAR